VQQAVQVGPPGTTTPVAPQTALNARAQLLPQSLRAVLSGGLAVRITSNLKADGLTTLSLSRADAKRAHLHVTRATSVVIGNGTIAGIKDGSMTIHVRVPRATASRLAKLHRVTFSLRLQLRGPSKTRATLDLAGRY
jgi:hypothetical protein